MLRTRAVSAIVALVLAAGAAPALAAGHIPAPEPAAKAFPLAAQETKSDIAAFRHVGQPLTLAIGLAERKGGGRPLAATFAANGGRPVFNVEIYRGGRMSQLAVDANSGRVLHSRRLGAAHLGKPAQRLLSHSQMTLAQAVARAEQLAHGKAIEAALARREGRLVYAVGIVTNGRVASMTIDPLLPHADTSMARSGVPRSRQ